MYRNNNQIYQCYTKGKPEHCIKYLDKIVLNCVWIMLFKHQWSIIRIKLNVYSLIEANLIIQQDDRW